MAHCSRSTTVCISVPSPPLRVVCTNEPQHILLGGSLAKSAFILSTVWVTDLWPFREPPLSIVRWKNVTFANHCIPRNIKGHWVCERTSANVWHNNAHNKSLTLSTYDLNHLKSGIHLKNVSYIQYKVSHNDISLWVNLF